MTLTIENLLASRGHEKGTLEVGKSIYISRGRSSMLGTVVAMSEKAVKVQGRNSGKTAWFPKFVLKIELGIPGDVACELKASFRLTGAAYWLWNEEAGGPVGL